METDEKKNFQKDRSQGNWNGMKKDYETEQCTKCSGWFKKGRGLKIHLKKSSCGGKRPNSQRKFHKSEVGSIQEKHHSSAAGCVNPVGAQHHPQTRSMSKKADANQTNLRSWVLKEKAQSDNKEKVLKGRQTEKSIEDLQTIVERFDVTLSQTDREFVEKLTEGSSESNGKRKLNQITEKKVDEYELEDKREFETVAEELKSEADQREVQVKIEPTSDHREVQIDVEDEMMNETKSDIDQREVYMKETRDQREVQSQLKTDADHRKVQRSIED